MNKGWNQRPACTWWTWVRVSSVVPLVSPQVVTFCASKAVFCSPKINSLFHFGLKVCQLLGVCVMFCFFSSSSSFWRGVKTNVVLMCSCSAAERIPLSSPSVGKKTACLLWIPPGFVCVPCWRLRSHSLYYSVNLPQLWVAHGNQILCHNI